MTTPLRILCLALVIVTTAWGQKLVHSDGFERCGTDRTGAILPEGWILNRGLCKNNHVSVSREADLVRNGRLSLYIEHEIKGVTLLMNWDPMRVKTGDKLHFQCWALGRGKLSLGYICNNTKGLFLGTIAAFKTFASDETWTQVDFSYTLPPFRKNDQTYTDLTIIPIIYVLEEAELNLDDYTFHLESQNTIDNKPSQANSRP